MLMLTNLPKFLARIEVYYKYVNNACMHCITICAYCVIANYSIVVVSEA